QVVRHAVRALLQLGKRHATVAAHDRRSLGHRVHGVLDQIRDVVCHNHKLEHVIVLGNSRPSSEGTLMGQPQDAPHALVEQRGHTLIVTMNRPELKNALTGDMLAIMSEAWDRVDEDPEIRCCVLTGAGGSFCAGADLKNMTANSPSKSFESGSFDPSR